MLVRGSDAHVAQAWTCGASFRIVGAFVGGGGGIAGPVGYRWGMGVQSAEYKRRFTSVLRDVGIPEPFGVAVFCDHIAARRNRRLELHDLPTGVGRVCGLYVSLPAVDHVFFAPGTSARHRQHIIVHELMHLLFGHGGLHGLSTEVMQRLLPGLDPGLVRAVLARGGYSDPEEQEAETVASLVMQHVGHPSPPTNSDPIAAQIETTLG